MRAQRRLLFSILYLIYFLDIGGIGVVFVLFTPLIVNNPQLFGLTHLSIEQRNVILGLLYAAYPLCQFFGAPLLGEISDRFGRKKPLVFSALMTGFAFFLSAVAIGIGNLFLLFFSRILAGLGAGNVTIALASVSDLIPEPERPKYMGTFNMVGGISWILLPFFGSFFSNSKILPFFTPSTPFWMMAVLFCLGGILVSRLFPHLNVKEHKGTFHLFHIFKELAQTFKIPKIAPLLGISILTIFAWLHYQGFIAPYLDERYHFSEMEIGTTFAYFSFWWFIGGILANRLLRKGHAAAINLFPMLLAPLAILSFDFIPNSQGMWLATAVANMSEALLTSCFFALFSTEAPNNVQGKIFGCWNAGFALSATFGPIVSGWLSFFNINAPFTFAAILHFIAFLLYFLWKRRFAI